MQGNDWIMGLFRDYYSRNKKSIFNVEKREFGIGVFGRKIAKRHMAFFSDEELNSYLSSDPPLFISHSVGYYEFPDATPMEKKNWLGSELVFDLDSPETSDEAMKIMKQELKKLIEIMKDEFGARDMLIAFSGNRGYHLHVRDKGFLPMNSDDRKRIIEYVKAEGFDHRKIFELFRKRMKNELLGNPQMIPGPNPGNWGAIGRFARKSREIFSADPLQLSRRLRDQKNLESFLSGIDEGNWGRGHGQSEEDLMQKISPISEIIKVRCDIDPAVTQDPTKLIRMPGSLHGSTGLEVKILKESEIEDFDPFSHSVVLPDDKIEIMLKEDVNIRMKEIVLKAKKGQRAKVPAFMAAYLYLKEKAEFTS
jgi:DNA primase small subunit